MRETEAIRVAPTGEKADSLFTNETSDENLLQMYREGNKDAFSELVNRHRSALIYWLTKKYRGYSKLDTEGIAQEAFLGIARCTTFEDRGGTFRTFLYMLARNKTIDSIRHIYGHDRKNPLTIRLESDVPRSERDEDGDVLTTPDYRFGRQVREEARLDEIRDIVGWALARISPKYAEAVSCVYLEDRTHEDAAHKLGLPLGTVLSRVYKGRCELRTLLLSKIKSQSIGK